MTKRRKQQPMQGSPSLAQDGANDLLDTIFAETGDVLAACNRCKCETQHVLLDASAGRVQCSRCGALGQLVRPDDVGHRYARDLTREEALADRSTVEVSDIVVNLAALYQHDQPMMTTQFGALIRWVTAHAATFEEACVLGKAAGLDDEHARSLAHLAAFKPVTRVRFETDNDEDASRLAATMGSLGFTPIRVVKTAEHRDRWALGELLRPCKLSPSEHDLAATKLGIRTFDARPNAYVEQCLIAKIGGKTLEQAVAEIAEVVS